jgi:NADH:ubiquinone oxidoreductase subunit 3 (subunit A)
MDASAILTSPFVVFVLALFAAGIIYAIGGKIAPPISKSLGKLSQYACGEDLPAEKVPVSIQMFDYAALFMVFDVIAMTVILSWGVSVAKMPLVFYLALVYVGLMFIALLVLVRRRQVP